MKHPAHYLPPPVSTGLTRPWVLLSLLAALCGSLLFVYRGGLLAVPFADEISFMRSRLFAESDLQFFTNSLSYDRLYNSHNSLRMLFRPLRFAVNAILNLVAPDKLMLTGLLSLATHAAVCALLWT